jgi:hypothetical protein
MAVEGVTGAQPEPVMTWVRAGLALDGYLTELRPDRPERPVEKGWKHVALAALAAEKGCHVLVAADLTLEAIAQHIRADRIVIASVSSELGEEDTPITRRSGHLVVIYGVGLNGDTVTEVVLHNPSGRVESLRAGARISAGRISAGFSGRGIIVGRRSE